eukprot:m.173486 g.173486  ORF g.173486 m.173486 type:complete len:83 (+) comp31726_c2_seq3:241-489(+)
MLVVGLLLLVCALMIARYLHSTSTFHIKTLKSVLRDSDPNVDNQTVLLVIAHPDDEVWVERNMYLDDGAHPFHFEALFLLKL